MFCLGKVWVLTYESNHVVIERACLRIWDLVPFLLRSSMLVLKCQHVLPTYLELQIAQVTLYTKKDFNFFSTWVFFHSNSRITGLEAKGEGISLIPHYHLHPLHKHIDISRAIITESLPLQIASSWTRTRKHWFPSASR